MIDTPAAPAPADLTAEQIYAMTPEEAGAALAAMDRAIHPPPSVVPQDAQDCEAAVGFALTQCVSGRIACSREMSKHENSLTSSWPRLARSAMMLLMPSSGLSSRLSPLFETTANGELPRRHVEGAIAA